MAKTIKESLFGKKDKTAKKEKKTAEEIKTAVQESNARADEQRKEERARLREEAAEREQLNQSTLGQHGPNVVVPTHPGFPKEAIPTVKGKAARMKLKKEVEKAANKKKDGEDETE